MASQRIFEAIRTPHSLDAQRGDAQRTYTRHHPEESILYDVIQRELEPFLARAQAREQPVPRFVEQELQALLRCGILAHGFLRLHCDDCGFERMCRYVVRPPLANERLEERPDGGLALRLKTRWRDGTSHILMARSELIDRLVPLIPPPRAHQVRYH